MRINYRATMLFLGIALAVTFGSIMFTSSTTPPTPEDEKVLRHVVLFKFKEGTTAEAQKKVEAAFAALPDKIPEITSFEWGTNNSPEGLDKGFTHCFFLTFENEADRDTYLPHPDHKVFGEIAGAHIEDVLVVDYWTE